LSNTTTINNNNNKRTGKRVKNRILSRLYVGNTEDERTGLKLETTSRSFRKMNDFDQKGIGI